MPRIKVYVWRDSYYPCGYQTCPLRTDLQRRIQKHLQSATGAHGDKTTAVFNTLDDFPCSISPHQRKDIEDGWAITLIVDAWEYAHLYGYDTHTLFGGR